MRCDVHYYFQQAFHRPLQPNSSPLRFVSDGDVAAAFLVRIEPPDTIGAVEYRCTTCMTLVAVCEHIAEEIRGSTVALARTLTAERILEQHPEYRIAATRERVSGRRGSGSVGKSLTMKVAYIFATQGHTVSYKLGRMILPQLEEGRHGVDVVGMFFFEDNCYALMKGNPIGERLRGGSKKSGMLLMGCDQCCYERDIADKLIDGVPIGCFPDLYKALSGNMPDQVITL